MMILLTGASGFLGNVIKAKLSDHTITTLGRSKADIMVDLAEAAPLFPKVDMVIHAAGKAHTIATSDKEVQDFFNVNVNGTKNLLSGLTDSPPEIFIFISTVAVYGLGFGNGINESEPLSAKDPYGLSKIQAERLVQDWCGQHNVVCSILRLPLIAGSNPPGNLRSMIRGIERSYYFNISGGKAKKSVVLAEDVAKIIPIVGEVGGVYNLTDGYHPSFSELSRVIATQVGKGKPANIPNWLASIMATAGDLLGSKAPINSDKLLKMTSDLTFDDSKARQMLGWNPTPVLKGLKIH